MLIDFYRERKGERGRGREAGGTAGQGERDRERQRDREKHLLVSSHTCPDCGSNLRPSRVWDDAVTN